MGYLDRDSYEKLVAKQESEPVVVTVDSLNDKTDRTLTFGKNVNGTTIHVFIKDGVLHAHEYVEFPSEDYFTVNWVSSEVPLNLLRPSFYAVPEVTDTEFAELMRSLNHGLAFSAWGSQLVMEYVSGYFGSIRRAD